MGQGSNYAFQIYIGGTTQSLKTRHRNTSGVWTAWRDYVAERGSNSNGEYTRFPDGTQICWGAVGGPSSSPNTGQELSWTYPIAFSASPSVMFNGGVVTSQTTGIAAQMTSGLPHVPGVSSVRIHLWNFTGITVGGTAVRLAAVGRWN